MSVSSWFAAVHIAKTNGVLGRIKASGSDLPEQWAVVFIPSESYLETGVSGPVSVRQVEWLDIQTFAVERVGKLVPDRAHDKGIEITSALKEVGAMFSVFDGFIRVLPPNISLQADGPVGPRPELQR